MQTLKARLLAKLTEPMFVESIWGEEPILIRLWTESEHIRWAKHAEEHKGDLMIRCRTLAQSLHDPQTRQPIFSESQEGLEELARMPSAVIETMFGQIIEAQSNNAAKKNSETAPS